MNAEAASTILKEGMVISTRINSSGTWYENIVYKSQSNVVYISLLDNYLENIAVSGTGIILKSSNEYFEYIFEGIIENVSIEHPGYIKVLVKSAEEKLNSRTYPRYDTYLASTIRLPWDDVDYFSIVTNISYGGVAFVAKYEFNTNEKIYISIYLPGHKVVGARGKIVRKSVRNEFTEYGIHFEEMPEAHRTSVMEFIAKLEKNKQKLQTNYYNNVKKLLKL